MERASNIWITIMRKTWISYCHSGQNWVKAYKKIGHDKV